MDNKGGNGARCFEVEIWADTAKFTSVVVSRIRKCRDSIGESEVLSKIKPRLRGEWVMLREELCIFSKLLFKSNKKKFCFRRVTSKKIGSHPGRDLL